MAEDTAAPAEPPADDIAAAVVERFPGSVARDSHGQPVVYVDAGAWHEVAAFPPPDRALGDTERGGKITVRDASDGARPSDEPPHARRGHARGVRVPCVRHWASTFRYAACTSEHSGRPVNRSSEL